MRYVGRIADWNDDKGFGFVVPNGGGDRSFAHIKAFGRITKRPETGDLISYELRKDERGRYNAASIRFVTPRLKDFAPARRSLRRPVALSFLAVLAIGWAFGKIPINILLAYVVVSAVSFLLYRADKSAATRNDRRTPENALHFFDLLGGWPGALLAQVMYRHKTSKASFQTVFWLSVFLNVGTLVWLLMGDSANGIDQILFG